MIKIGISMIKNWYSNYLYFNDQHFKKPMVPFVSWSLLSLGPFWPWSLLSLGPFWPWSLLAMVPFGSWSLLAGPFWPVPFGRSLMAWSLLTSNVIIHTTCVRNLLSHFLLKVFFVDFQINLTFQINITKPAFIPNHVLEVNYIKKKNCQKYFYNISKI